MLLALPGIIALAWDPLLWLAETWRAPAYASDGAWIAFGVGALICASVLSGPAQTDSRHRRWAWALLGLTAALRLVGQVLAVNTIGALALAIDVAAIGLLLSVSQRPFALSPWVLAGLFSLSLPLEHHGQRLLGHPLQLVAARISEGVLLPFFPDLSREGVLLIHPAIELAVDLPCSGARGLAVFTSMGLALWTCHRLSFGRAVSLGAAIGVGALLANASRIVALFVGGAHGIPVVDEPWHSALGAGALALGATPMLAIFRGAPRRKTLMPWPRTLDLETSPFAHPSPDARPTLSWTVALSVCVVGLAVANAPSHPIDSIAIDDARHLPTTLGEFNGSRVVLAPDEERFFSQWGGRADKREYRDGTGGQHTALWVRTRSPLRHLHGPDLCLIGSGHEVTRIGVVPGDMPSIIYKSVAPDGGVWRVEATFASDKGDRASSVSEVVWRWLAQPDDTWNLVERISPWNLCEYSPERCAAFDRALFAGLDFPASNQRVAIDVPRT